MEQLMLDALDQVRGASRSRPLYADDIILGFRHAELIPSGLHHQSRKCPHLVRRPRCGS